MIKRNKSRQDSVKYSRNRLPKAIFVVKTLNVVEQIIMKAVYRQELKYNTRFAKCHDYNGEEVTSQVFDAAVYN